MANRKVKPEYEDICKRICTIRERAVLTQQDFAAAIGETRASVSAIEAGYFTPSFKMIRKIHKKFSIPYEYIIDGTSGINPSIDLIKEQAKTKELEERIEILMLAISALRHQKVE